MMTTINGHATGQLGRGEPVEERVVDLDVRQAEEQLGHTGGEQQRAQRDEDRLDAHERRSTRR